MRLLYVAMTRAKDHLDLLVPQRFHVTGQAASGDRHVYANRTRFIPSRLLGYFDQLSWPPAEPAIPAATPDSGARQNAIDLAARMRAMWQ
jgi:DNA helicase-2/ATP-dependent DNA helicase PcrA